MAERGAQLLLIRKPTACFATHPLNIGYYDVNQNLDYFDNVIFKEVFVRIRVVFTNQNICIYVGQSWINYIDLPFSLERGIVVWRAEKYNIVKLLHEERDFDSMYYNKSLELSDSTSDSHHPWSS